MLPGAALAQSSAPPPSQASQSPAPMSESDALIAHGVELRQHGQDEDALQEFRRAYEASHSARAMAQIALAEQALGHWSDAYRDINIALGDTAEPWLQRNRRVLEGARDTIAQHLGSLTVVSNVPGAELYLNGNRIGTLPMRAPVHVEAGTVAIEVRAAGYDTARRTIEVEAGGSKRESLYSSPVQVAGSTASTSPGGAGGTTDQGTGTSPIRTAGLGALVGGAVLLLGGVGAQIYWQNRVGLYNSDQCVYPGFQRSQVCGAVLDNANAGVNAMAGLYIAGGVVAVAGLVMFLAAPSGSRPAAAHARGVQCGPGPGDVGITCAGRF
jgi:hypothetical protein